MKTSRRHELQTNALADSLAHWIDRVKPYSRAILAVVVALVVVIFAWGYLSAQRTRQSAEGWNEYFQAIQDRDPREALEGIAARYAGSEVSDFARLTLADLQLKQGTDRLFMQKADARDELRQATEKYRALLGDTRQEELQQRATFGLARAHEALATPETLEAARKEYRSIGEKWPNSPYAKDATERANDLDRAATKQFYDWVAKYEPPRPMTGEPGTPGARHDFLKDPLDDAGPKLPSAADDVTLPKLDLDPKASPPGSEATEAPEKAPAPSDAPAAPSDEPPKSVEPPASSDKPAASSDKSPAPSDEPPPPSDEPPKP
jgi:hypothetical protein